MRRVMPWGPATQRGSVLSALTKLLELNAQEQTEQRLKDERDLLLYEIPYDEDGVIKEPLYMVLRDELERRVDEIEDLLNPEDPTVELVTEAEIRGWAPGVDAQQAKEGWTLVDSPDHDPNYGPDRLAWAWERPDRDDERVWAFERAQGDAWRQVGREAVEAWRKELDREIAAATPNTTTQIDADEIVEPGTSPTASGGTTPSGSGDAPEGCPHKDRISQSDESGISTVCMDCGEVLDKVEAPKKRRAPIPRNPNAPRGFKDPDEVDWSKGTERACKTSKGLKVPCLYCVKAGKGEQDSRIVQGDRYLDCGPDKRVHVDCRLRAQGIEPVGEGVDEKGGGW